MSESRRMGSADVDVDAHQDLVTRTSVFWRVLRGLLGVS